MHASRLRYIVLIPVLLWPPLYSDTIVLKNGNNIEGNIIGQKKDKVQVQLPYGIQEIPRREIRELKFKNSTSNLLFQGRRLLYHGDFTLALQQFEKAAAEDPHNKLVREALLDAYFTYASFLHETKRYEEALALLEKFQGETYKRKEAGEKTAAIKQLLAEYRPKLAEVKAHLRRKEFSAAHTTLEELWRLYPGRHEALKQPFAYTKCCIGDKALARRDFVPAARYYEEALVYNPDYFPQLVTRYTYAQAHIARRLLDKEKYRESYTVLHRALTFFPSSKTLRYLLGQTLQEMGHFNRAIALFKSIESPGDDSFSLQKGLDHYAELVEREIAGRLPVPEASEGNGFAITKTKNFKVYCPGKQSSEKIAEVLERHFADLAPIFSIKGFKKRCFLYVHPTQKQYHEATGTSAWSPASATWKSKFGDLLSHEIHTYFGCPQLLSSVLRHELTHILLAAHLDYKEVIPLWANEGIAILSEPDFKHQYYTRLIRQNALQKKLIPVAAIIGKKAYYPREDEVRLFYAQSYSLTRYLTDKMGLELFLAFLKTLDKPNNWKIWKQFTKFRSAVHLEQKWRDDVLAVKS